MVQKLRQKELESQLEAEERDNFFIIIKRLSK